MFCSSECTSFQILFSGYPPLKGTRVPWKKWLVAGLGQGWYRMNLELNFLKFRKYIFCLFERQKEVPEIFHPLFHSLNAYNSHMMVGTRVLESSAAINQGTGCTLAGIQKSGVDSGLKLRQSGVGTVA